MIFALIVSLLICLYVPPSNGLEGKNAVNEGLNLMNLEGTWKVVSATWGGEDDLFSGKEYKIDVLEDSVETVDYGGSFAGKKGVQFLADIDGLPVKINVPFCAMQYANEPDSIKFFQGFPKPVFWRNEQYPCNGNEFNDGKEHEIDILEEGMVLLGGLQYLIRVDVKSSKKAHVIVFYNNNFIDISQAGDNTSDDWESDDFEYRPNHIDIISKSSGMGLFELELEKVK